MARSDTSPPAASVEALLILSERRAYSVGIRPDVLTTVPLSALATPSHILTIIPAPLKGMRKVVRVQVALQGMTVLTL